MYIYNVATMYCILYMDFIKYSTYGLLFEINSLLCGVCKGPGKSVI